MRKHDGTRNKSQPELMKNSGSKTSRKTKEPDMSYLISNKLTRWWLWPAAWHAKALSTAWLWQKWWR